jgi:hypothetical protein
MATLGYARVSARESEALSLLRNTGNQCEAQKWLVSGLPFAGYSPSRISSKRIHGPR